MEYSQPQRLGKAKAGGKVQGKDGRSDPLHRQAAENHGFLKPHHPLHIVEAQGLGHDHPLLQADALAEQEDEKGGHGHKAQTADLDEAQQHPLAEAAPLGIGVKGGQAGYTGGGGGGKQGTQQIAALPGPGRNRQGQQNGSQQDQNAEGGGNDLGWAQGLAPVFHCPGDEPIFQ